MSTWYHSTPQEIWSDAEVARFWWHRRQRRPGNKGSCPLSSQSRMVAHLIGESGSPSRFRAAVQPALYGAISLGSSIAGTPGSKVDTLPQAILDDLLAGVRPSHGWSRAWGDHHNAYPPVTLICRATAGLSWRRSMMKSWPFGLREIASRIASSSRSSVSRPQQRPEIAESS